MNSTSLPTTTQSSSRTNQRPWALQSALVALALSASGLSIAGADLATYHSFSTSNTISRFNGNGGAEHVFGLPHLGSYTQASGIAIDPVAKKLYYARTNFIASINLDGTGNAIIKDFGINSPPSHLELDVANGHLYTYFNGHSQGVARGIYRLNTDGSGFIPIVTAAKLAALTPSVDPLVTQNGADGLVLDLTNSRIYWSDERRLRSCSLAGTDPELVSTFPFSISSFEINVANSKLYYADSTRIERSNLDGTSRETVFAPGFGFPEALELDPSRDRLYFIQGGALRYTNLDGSLSPVEVRSVGAARGKDIELGPMPAISKPKVVSIARIIGGGSTSVRIGYTTDPGIQYTLQTSADLSTWAPTGITVTGTGTTMTSDLVSSAVRKFFRVVQLDPSE